LETPPALNPPHGFGPFEGHLVGCEYDTRRLIRMSLQRVGDEYQGAAYPFSYDTPVKGPTFAGPIVCSVAPNGDLYVGSLRESGWGGGNNTGEIVKLSYAPATLPAGIAEILAMHDGFTIKFTQPVQRSLAADVSRYHVMSYRRISTPKYGGDDVDRREEQVAAVTVAAADRVHVRLADRLRSGFVYEFRLQPLVEGTFFPSEGHYTLNLIPAE
jgi:hypothetical protein